MLINNPSEANTEDIMASGERSYTVRGRYIGGARMRSVEWCYVRYLSGKGGEDAGFIDNISNDIPLRLQWPEESLFYIDGDKTPVVVKGKTYSLELIRNTLSSPRLDFVLAAESLWKSTVTMAARKKVIAFSVSDEDKSEPRSLQIVVSKDPDIANAPDIRLTSGASLVLSDEVPPTIGISTTPMQMIEEGMRSKLTITTSSTQNQDIGLRLTLDQNSNLSSDDIEPQLPIDIVLKKEQKSTDIIIVIKKDARPERTERGIIRIEIVSGTARLPLPP